MTEQLVLEKVWPDEFIRNEGGMRNSLFILEALTMDDELRDNQQNIHRIIASPTSICYVACVNEHRIARIYGSRATEYLDAESPLFIDDLTGFIDLAESGIYLASYGVVQPYRSQGIGCAMLQEFLRDAHDNRYKYVLSHALEGNSLTLHQKLGGHILGRYQHSTGLQSHLVFFELDEIMTTV